MRAHTMAASVSIPLRLQRFTLGPRPSYPTLYWHSDVLARSHRQQNKCYPLRRQFLEKLKLTAALCTEI